MKQYRVLAAALLPLVLSGCSFWDDWFAADKPPLPGKREDVMMPTASGLENGGGAAPRVTLPRPATNADWPQAGGLPSHDMEHPALADSISRAWSSSIGAGGGYRRKITAQPVAAGGLVFAMDSDAYVSAFDAATGRSVWSASTEDEENRSTNIGGGIAWDSGTLYAATGRAEVVAFEAATGKVLWHARLPAGARAAPTVGDGRLYIPLIDSRLVAVSVKDGSLIWSYQGGTADPIVLGMPSPAFAEGLLAAGFGSGDLVALNPATGALVWSDSLASGSGRTSLAEVSSVRGRPVVKDGRLYAASLGNQLAAFDLRSGRRLWEREVGSTETPWVAGDFLFLVTPDAQVAAISLADGLVAWTAQLDGYEDMKKKTGPIRWLGPVLAGDRLVLAGTNGEAVALSPYTGQVLGKQDLSGRASVAPAVAGGTLYVVTDDATLSAFR